MRVAVALVFLLLSGAAVEAQPRNPLYGEPSDFLGTWNNVEIQRNLVVRIEIHPEYGRRVRVIIFGLRNGEPCIFGEYRGAFFVSKFPREREEDNSAILVRVDREWVQGHILLRFNRHGEIVSHALLNLADQGPIYNVEHFAASRRRYGGEGEEYPRPERPYYRGY